MRGRIKLMNKEKKKKKLWFKILAFILLLLIVGAVIAYFMLDRYSYKELNLTDEELGIEKVEKAASDDETKEVVEVVDEETDVYDDQIINVALFGLDRRDTESINTRSDSIMVATLDFKNDKLKLTSFMRDLFVEIEEKGEDKLNHAYAYGGAELAIKTMNQNFGLDVRDYVTVDFFMLRDIINILGGVSIDVKEEEIKLLNEHMQEIANRENKQVNLVREAGEQLLSGEQAVAYSRIRYVGNGDFERTERQQKVLQAMLSRINVASKVELTKLFLEISPYIETSLKKEELISLAWNYLSTEDMVLEKMRYPLDNTWSADYTDAGAWVMKVDVLEQKKSIQNWIYDDVNPLGEVETEIVVDEKKVNSTSTQITEEKQIQQ